MSSAPDNAGPMKYAYYPGCSLHSTAKEYDASTRAVSEALGVELVEIPDWNCCGASSAHGEGHLLSTGLPGRNILLAEQMGLDIAVPCAACYNRLAVANAEMRSDPGLAEKISGVVGLQFQGTSDVRPLVDVIVNDVGLDAIAAKVRRPLEGLKVACYYGCLLVRPPRVLGFDDADEPMTMDNLVTALGGEPVTWPHKTECCGASFSLTRVDVVQKMTGDVLRMARDCGANCVVCACPLCMTNLDMRQRGIESLTGEKIGLPIFYFTELLALAMGLDMVKNCWKMHFVSPEPLLRETAAV